jgi:hypothetical protein
MLSARCAIAAAVLALAAGPASGTESGDGTAEAGAESGIAQDCMVELRRLNDLYARHTTTLGGRHMRSLFEAARVFASNGQREHCMAVVDGMRIYAEEIGARGDLQGPDALRDAAENAVPIADTDNVSGRRFFDDVVVSPAGEMLGEIEDIVSRQGTHYLVVGSGGFLDVGQDYRPVRLERFSRIDETVLLLEVAEDVFDEAPAFEIERLELDIDAWGERVDAWWRENVARTDAD